MVEAWYDPTNHVVSIDKHDPRFTALGQLWKLVPERGWVSLTDEERFLNDCRSEQEIEYAKAIEAKLKEKNCA